MFCQVLYGKGNGIEEGRNRREKKKLREKEKKSVYGDKGKEK